MLNRPPSATSYDRPLPPSAATWLADGWEQRSMRSGAPDDVATIAARRRRALADQFPGEAIVVAAGSPTVRANDTTYRFRASSDFVWLTGYDEPDAVLVIAPSRAERLYVNLPHPRGSIADFTDRVAGGVWVGRRPTADELTARLDLEVRPLTELAPVLDEVGDDDDLVRRVKVALHELRLVKDATEIDQIELAVAATTRGFEDVVRELPRAVSYSERWIEGTFDRRARTDGNEPGYQTIVAAGANASVLHWTRNDGPVRPGDMLLIDAGVELPSHYTADVTRTLPISGRFTRTQRDVYELVLAAQQAGIDAVRPGAPYSAIYDACMRVLAEGLASWGLLPVDADAALAPDGQQHRRYTVCGTGHMLGLDVHDCSAARDEQYAGGTLVAGNVLTVEPGLYFQPDDRTLPVDLRGVGVRIEDDLLVTPDGNRNLSAALPRRPEDVESWMGSR